MIRFCGFPLSVCYELATALIPIFPRLAPHSEASPNPIWFRADAPVCDLLDIVVLKLREIATVGYQHQLETDMGVPRGSLWKYLKMGKYGLRRILCTPREQGGHPKAHIGLFDSVEEARAAFFALEKQFGACPQVGLLLAYFFDGTVQRLHRVPTGPERDIWWSGNKKYYGFNTGLLASAHGLIHWFNACLPGSVNDARAATAVFEAIQDPEFNPHRVGAIVDFGLSVFCTHHGNWAVVARPMCPGKDRAPSGRGPEMIRWRHLVAEYSAWLTTARQANEWINGDNKKGFPRWLMLSNVRWVKRMRTDLVLFLHLFNFRVRSCDWSQTKTVFKAAIAEYYKEQGLVVDPETGDLLSRDGERAEPEGDSDVEVDSM
jgi:hypothetical protein